MNDFVLCLHEAKLWHREGADMYQSCRRSVCKLDSAARVILIAVFEPFVCEVEEGVRRAVFQI